MAVGFDVQETSATGKHKVGSAKICYTGISTSVGKKIAKRVFFKIPSADRQITNKVDAKHDMVNEFWAVALVGPVQQAGD